MSLLLQLNQEIQLVVPYTVGRVKFQKKSLHPMGTCVWVQKTPPRSLGALPQIWPLLFLGFLGAPNLLRQVPLDLLSAP